MYFSNLNTGEFVDFSELYLYIKNRNLKHIKIKEEIFDISIYHINKKYTFRILIKNKNYFKLTILYKDRFSNIYSYISIFFINYLDLTELTINKIFSKIENQFYLEEKPSLIDPILYSDVIFKFKFPEMFSIPEDVLLEIDIYALELVKQFVTKKQKIASKNLIRS